MAERSVVIIGLPESGKTTFLAALWHLITERDIVTKLKFGNLRAGEVAHLNAIAARWRDAKMQERTAIGGNKLVSMNLIDEAAEPLTVSFPDVAGEAYRRMWEERMCDDDVADFLRSGGVLFFVHADRIRPPHWVMDVSKLARDIGLKVEPGKEVPWHPRLSPTQVQAVGLLQLLRDPPLAIEGLRLAIMLSAWDKVSPEGLSPEEFVAAKLPLLWQYLRQHADRWDWRIYGLSAQGGDYDSTEPNAVPNPKAEEIRRRDQPTKRISLVHAGKESHDLTEPLAWLMN